MHAIIERMELVLAIAVLVLAALLGLLLWHQRGNDRQPPDTGVSTPATSLEKLPATELAVRSEPTSRGGFQLIVNDRLLATLELAPDATPERPEIRTNRSTTAAMLELTRSVPHVAQAMRTAGFNMTFTKETLRGLSGGSLRLMSGSRAVAVDSATAQIVELGKVTGSGAGKLAASWPALLSGGIAVAAAAQQQHQLDAALNEINAGIEDLHQRHIDDDAGALLAAAHLASEVLSASQRGEIPAQIAHEVAIARREVEAVYFSRRQGVRRFITAIEQAQNDHEATKGEALAWPSGVEKAFGDAHRFHAETLAFVQAATVKAHLAAGTAALVAADGNADYAFDLLDSTDELLRRDVLELNRRLTALVSSEPQGLRNRSDRRLAHGVVGKLVMALDQHIAPLLPLEPADSVTVHFDRQLGPGNTDT